MVRRAECDEVAAVRRRLERERAARAARLEVQESQLAALAEQERGGGERLAAVRAEFDALSSAAGQQAQQVRSLAALREHLGGTRAEQERAAAALRGDVARHEAALAEASAALWDYKAEAAARVVALQRLAQERQGELERVRRLSEHEVDTLAAHNKALAEELKTTAESLLRVRGEAGALASTTRQALADGQLEVRRCTGVVELVGEQNAGLRSAIGRAEELLRQSAHHTGAKDSINHKSLVEQASLVGELHAELQSTLERVRLTAAQLCSLCRQQLAAELPPPQQGQSPNPRDGEAAAPRGGADAAAGPPPPPREGVESGSDKVAAAQPGAAETQADASQEVSRLREALDALSRELLQERAAREAGLQLEEDGVGRGGVDAEAARRAEEEWRRLERQDAAKKGAGEVALSYAVQFVDGTKRRVDAFPSDTVAMLISRVALRAGIVRWRMFHLAQLLDEEGVLGSVHRYLSHGATLEEEGVTPQTVLLFGFKHYKRPLHWDDAVAQEWFFRQLQQHVVREYYPVSEAVAVRLASYELQAVFGDFTAQKSLLYFDQVGLEAYLPISVSAHAYDYWQERLARNHRRRAGLTAAQARCGYIDLLSATPWWGLTFFDVRDRDNRPFLAGVAEDGFFVFSATKQECLDAVPFPDLAGWERCPAGVVVRRRGSHTMTLYATSQLQAKELVDLLNEYYLLLPQRVREEAHIDVVDAEGVRAGLASPTLFDSPVVGRPPPAPYGSRVECMKAAYMSYCTGPDELGRQRAPAAALLRAMDRAVDDGTALDALDLALSDPPVDDRHFAAIAEILTFALREYRPPGPRGEWRENVDVTAVLLAQPSAARQLLSASSVPRIAGVVALFPGLRTLDLAYIPLDTAAEQLGGALAAGATQLRRLVLKGCRIGARALQSLLPVVGSQPPGPLEHLSLEDNFLTHAAVHPLCELLRHGRTALAELNLAFNRLEPSGVDALAAAALAASPQLRSLDLSGNPGLQPPSMRAALLVAKGSGIAQLALRRCKLHFALLGAMDAELVSNDDVVELDLSTNPLGDGADARAATTAFRFLGDRRSVSHVEVLRMDECGLTEDGLGDALGGAVASNRALRRLSLRGNGLARATGFLPPLVADAVGVHPALCVLDLSDNGVSHAGCMRLFAALVRSKTICELYLDGNCLGDAVEPAGWTELVVLLENSASLNVLSLCNTGLPDAGLQRVGEGLSRNAALHTLVASGNAFTPSGVAAFARLIHRNVALKALDLSTETLRHDEAVYADTLRLLSGAGRLDSVQL
ncbi:putative ribonuclease inhibitor [Trypanosoma conorhini]|uniref:Putative ribonuclease inhibitor n=1 Tax=Trypanosoma conorhini TaxID=83891 RepID=A0A3R7KGW1_9TRYP|nr:putative ribonuclease inhibitor [Trypanosoma conorhini]RNF06260.1 putative ribonuclease inhibitor [Trypanosoma conorhini]